MIILVIAYLLINLTGAVTGQRLEGVASLTSNVEIGEFPFAVRIDPRDCMGSIATKFHVLTACHCLADLRIDSHPVLLSLKGCLVHAGTVRRDEPGDVRSCESFRVHKQCRRMRSGLVKHDVGIVKIPSSRPWVFGPNVQPFEISFSDRKKLSKNTTLTAREQGNCYVLGWGQHKVIVEGKYKRIKNALRTFPASWNDLKKLAMHVLPIDICQKVIVRLAKQIRMRSLMDYDSEIATHMCALPDRNNTATCFGDSGSPLICDKYVMGLVTVDAPCELSLPSLYTRIIPFLDMDTRTVDKGAMERKRSIEGAGCDRELNLGVSWLIFWALNQFLRRMD